MESAEVVCEWDAEECFGTLVVGCPQLNDSYKVTGSVTDALERFAVNCRLEEFRERRFTDGRCVPWSGVRAALLTRLSFSTGEDTRMFAYLVARGLGVEDRLGELE